MHNTLRILLLISVCIGCGPDLLPDKTTVLSGRLPEVEGGQLILYRGSERVNYTEWLTAMDTVTLAGDGSFAFRFPQTEGDFFQVCDLRGYPQFVDVYLQPGDSLHVAVTNEAQRFRSQYKGALADAYTYLDLLDSARQANPVFSLGYRNLCFLEADSVQNLIAHRMTQEKQTLESPFRSTSGMGSGRQILLGSTLLRDLVKLLYLFILSSLLYGRLVLLLHTR